MTGASWILLLALGAAGMAPPDAQELLASARGLYASAAYEEALAVLGTAEAAEPGVALEVERYRALCLFALGQRDAARVALATLVDQHPLYIPTEAELPPTLVSMVHEVRRELLPGIARRTYADVRSQLTSGKTVAAVPALQRIVQITSDGDVSGIEGMEDLRLLADGFLTLAKAAESAAPAPAAADNRTEVPTTSVGTTGTPAPPPPPALYTAADTDVVAPDPIQQEMPPWSVNRGPRTGMTFSGYLRLLVNESGEVESAALIRPIHPAYDVDLLRAAKYWRFVAAQKDGKPVRYLKVMKITIKDI